MAKSDMDAKHKYRFLDATGDNYVAWARRVQVSLKSEVVWRVVAPVGGADGGVARPVVANAAQRQWDTDDASALKVIFKYLDDTSIAKVEDQTTARAVWERLKQLYARGGDYERRLARGELAKIKLKWTEDINDLIRDAQEHFVVFTRPDPAALPGAAPPVALSDDEKIGYVCTPMLACGGRWRTIADGVQNDIGKSVRAHIAAVQAAGAAGANPPVYVPPHTWESFKEQLEREQRDRTSGTGGWTSNPAGHSTKTPYQRAHAAMVDGGMSDDEASAFLADVKDKRGGERRQSGGQGGGGQRGGKNKFVPRGPCFNCGQTGHAARDCENKQGCGRCGSKDHRHRDCPTRGGSDGGGAAGGGDDSGDSKPRAFSAKAGRGRSRTQDLDSDEEDRLSVDNDSVATFAFNKKLSKRERDLVAEYAGYAAAAQDTSGSSIASSKGTTCANAVWMLDSGCSGHMTPRMGELTRRRPSRHRWATPLSSVLNEYKVVEAHPGVRVANDDVIPVVGKGNAEVTTTTTTGEAKKLTLRGALHVPRLSENLASVTSFSDDGHDVLFKKYRGPAYILTDDHQPAPDKVAGVARHNGQVWVINDNDHLEAKVAKLMATLPINGRLAFAANLDLAHARFGDIGVERLKRACVQQLRRQVPAGVEREAKIAEIMKATLTFCEMCELANSKRRAMDRRARGTPHSRATEPNERLHIDACIVNVVARTGAVLFFVVVDCKSRYGYYQGMARRSDVYDWFLALETNIERQVNAPIKKIRTDNAPEVVAGRLGTHLIERGVEFELTTRDSSGMNGVAERRIESIQAMIRVMLTRSNLDDPMWDDAGRAANRIVNSTPSSSLPNWQSPHENRFGTVPDLSMARVWGCPAYVHIVQQQRESKVATRGIKGIYIGECDDSKAWLVLDPHTGVVMRSRDVKFDESFVTGYAQGRVERGATGARSLVFSPMGALDEGAEEDARPLPSTIAPLDEPLGEMIHPRAVQLLSRPAPMGAEVHVPDPGFLQHGGNEDENAPPAIEPEIVERGPNTPMLTRARARGEHWRPQQLGNAENNADGGDGERGAPPVRRSDRLPQPVQRDNNFVWPTPAFRQAGLHVHHNPDAGLEGGQQAQSAKATAKDNVEVLKELDKRGVTVLDIGRAMTARAVTRNAGKEQPDGGVDMRPIVFAIAEVLDRDPRKLIEILEMDEPEHGEWMEATRAQYDALMRNGTWRLIPPTPGKKSVDCMWVWKTKRDEDGAIIKRKARLVARGFTQRQGVDYNETWAPTAKPVSLRTMLAIGNAKEWRTMHSDVPDAYLKAFVKEHIEMKQPEGFEVEGKEDWVCLLQKAIYGLKQAGREWYELISATFTNDWGFKQSRVDPCMFFRHDDSGRLCAMAAIHVDDTLMVLRDGAEQTRMSNLMMEKYGAKCEEAHYYCGIRIDHDRSTRRLFLSQEAYIDKLLERFDLANAKIARTPAEAGVKLNKSMGPANDREREEMQKRPYASLVGALMWVAAMTRGDIVEAHHTLTKFVHDPGEEHWRAAVRVARYLKGTKRYGSLFDATGVTFTRNDDGTETLDQPITFHCDADYAGDLDDRRSTSGLHVQIAGGMVAARTKKQGGVSLSTMEAELISMGDAVQEHEFIDALLLEVGIKISKPSLIMEDNQAAIAYVKGGRSESKARHVGVRFHYIRDSVKDGKVKIVYCPTKEMIADMLTKALPADQFEYLRTKMGIRPLPVDIENRRNKTGVNNAERSCLAICGEWECREFDYRTAPQMTHGPRSVRWSRDGMFYG